MIVNNIVPMIRVAIFLLWSRKSSPGFFRVKRESIWIARWDTVGMLKRFWGQVVPTQYSSGSILIPVPLRQASKG